MSAQLSIAINDGQVTPVLRTFNPKGSKTQPDKRNIAIWRDQSPVSSVGFLSLTEAHTPVNSNGMEKYRYTFDVPTLESPSSGGTFTPPPTRAFGTIGVIEVWAHARASDVELRNIVAFIKNFSASSYFENAVRLREPAW